MKTRIITIILLASSAMAFSKPVSRDEAKQIAATLINPSAGQPRFISKNASNNTEAFYIFNDKSGNGWVMVAGDDIAQPVLAYSPTGSFRTTQMPENLHYWLEGYATDIHNAQERGDIASDETKQQWDIVRKTAKARKISRKTATVEPLIQTRWDQSNPYNRKCPQFADADNERALTGCVATAMAQIMYFHRWPLHGTGSLEYQPKDPRKYPYQVSTRIGKQSADFETTYYDWDNMLDHYIYWSENDKKWYLVSNEDKNKDAVALLMYQCGVATQMMYGLSSEGGSSTYTLQSSGKNSAQYALQTYFGYKNNMKGYRYTSSTNYNEWVQRLKDELSAGRPILYGGYYQDLSYGHSFVCDGYDSENRFHFNWGWSGMSDGYYALSALTPRTDMDATDTYNFSYNQEAIVGIEPNKSGEIIEKDEPVQKDYIANKVAMTYYPEYSDIETFVFNNVSLHLYVTDDDGYSAYFYFNVYLPEFNRLNFGVVQTENPYTSVELLNDYEDWYYICGDDPSTIKYYRALYEYQQPNCDSSVVSIYYKSKDTKGNLLYDISGKVYTTNGSVYTISAEDIAISGSSAMTDSSEPDGYRYTPMSLIDDDENTYHIEVLEGQTSLDGIENDSVMIGTSKLQINCTVQNTGKADFQGWLSGYIYKLQPDRSLVRIGNTSQTKEITFPAGAKSILPYSYSKSATLPAGQYCLVPTYSKDEMNWFEMWGDTPYFFTIYDPENPLPPIPTELSEIAVSDSINGIYSITGVRMATSMTQLPQGVYIVVTNNGAYKIFKQ